MGDVEFRSPATLLRARSIAIVGASERSRWGSLICRNLRQFGYDGRIALINPHQQEVFGERCFPSLRELPEPVEHAMLIVPAPAIAGVLDARSGRRQIRDHLRRRDRRWRQPEVARARRLAQAIPQDQPHADRGPNCMGAHCYREKLFAYPNAELCRVPPGPVGCIFQSGGTLQFWMRSGADRGLRFSYGISSGNEFDLDLADYLNFLVDDAETRQIVLFIEGIRRPAAFMHAAGRALAAGKPILAIKTGATAQSRAAAHRTPAPSPATTPPISPCASATASSIAARSTTCSRRRWRSSPRGCRRDRASASSPLPAAPSTCSTITPRRRARPSRNSRRRPTQR